MLQEFKNESEENDAESGDSAAVNDGIAVSVAKPPVSRFQIMGFGGIVAALGVLGYMHMRGPAGAAASVTAAPSAEANLTISQFLSGGATNIHDMETSLQNTQKQVHIFENYPSARQVPLGNLHTNPFAYRTDDKSAGEAERQKAEHEAEIEKAAQGLKLQSIMFSGRPHGRSACMINNALCGAGEQIGGFTITKINPDSVMLSQGSLSFELKIQR